MKKIQASVLYTYIQHHISFKCGLFGILMDIFIPEPPTHSASTSFIFSIRGCVLHAEEFCFCNPVNQVVGWLIEISYLR